MFVAPLHALAWSPIGGFFNACLVRGASMDKPPHGIEPEWLAALKFWGPVVALTLFARVLWHRNLVVKGLRQFWGRELLWELGTAVLCFAISMGVVDYFNLSIKGACAAATFIGWLGPKGLQAIILGRGKGV